MRIIGNLSILAILASAIGCGGSSSGGNANIRGINVVHGASSLNITADTGIVGSGISYGAGTAYMSGIAFPETVTATDPTTSTQVGITTLTPNAGGFYTVVGYGVEGGTPAAAMTIIPDSVPTLSTTAANVRYGNFSASIDQAVDVYITSSTATISGSPTFSNIAYGACSSYVSVKSGTYRIRVFATGTTTSPLVDVASSTLANNSDYTLMGADASSTQGELLLLSDSF